MGEKNRKVRPPWRLIVVVLVWSFRLFTGRPSSYMDVNERSRSWYISRNTGEPIFSRSVHRSIHASTFQHCRGHIFSSGISPPSSLRMQRYDQTSKRHEFPLLTPARPLPVCNVYSSKSLSDHESSAIEISEFKAFHKINQPPQIATCYHLSKIIEICLNVWTFFILFLHETLISKNILYVSQ